MHNRIGNVLHNELQKSPKIWLKETKAKRMKKVPGIES